ncbi:hypothetical protein ABEU20_003843 [Rhodococcus sp. PAM 2766]|uniref:Uncharacterized protein n=1 Tax=Rhodococcus parequi TaxID=3137122 RepID=A0ABW9FI92_9NOCA
MIEPDSRRESAAGCALPIGPILHLGIRYPELSHQGGGITTAVYGSGLPSPVPDDIALEYVAPPG